MNVPADGSVIGGGDATERRILEQAMASAYCLRCSKPVDTLTIEGDRFSDGFRVIAFCHGEEDSITFGMKLLMRMRMDEMVGPLNNLFFPIPKVRHE